MYEQPTTNQPMSELEMLKMQMNAKTDETLESTRNMVRMCDESQKAGSTALNQLYAQGEQLRRVDTDMDQIHEDLTSAQRDLEEMDKCCGLCVLPWKKKKNPLTTNQYGYPSSGNNVNQSSNYRGPQDRNHQFNQQRHIPPNSGQTYITRITNDDRETEMEENLQQVSGMVSELHYMATDMGQEIRTHNEILKRIDDKADSNQRQMMDAQRQADQLIGSSSQPKTNDNSLLPSNPRLAVAKMMIMK